MNEQGGWFLDRYVNFQSSQLAGDFFPKIGDSITQGTNQQATLQPFRLTISRTHMKMERIQSSMGQALTFFDLNIPDTLTTQGFTQGIIQFIQQTHNPTKENAGVPATWHWDEVSLNPSIPFSMIKADKRAVPSTSGGSDNTVTFNSPAPANAYVRFSAIGKTDVSFDNGSTWVPAHSTSTNIADGTADSYFTPIPQGTQTIRLRFSGPGLSGNYIARDFSIWSLTTSGTTPSPATPTPAPGFIYDDEFNGTTLDSSWVALDRYGDISNNDLQCYKPSQVSVSGGILNITAEQIPTTCGASNAQYRSGMIQWRTFNINSGHLEVRAKMSGGNWPAIWLLGTDCQPNNVFDANDPACHWPQAGSDENDVAEFLGSDYTHVNQQVHNTVGNSQCSPQISDASVNFHVYSLDWTPGSLVYKVDGVTTCTITGAQVFNTSKFLIINNAVSTTHGGPLGTFPKTIQVDYVRVTNVGSTNPTPTNMPTTMPTTTPTPTPTRTPTPTPTRTPTPTMFPPTLTPTPTTIFKVGDINHDGTVGLNDFSILLSDWTPVNNLRSDLNHDNTVGLQDFSILLSNWDL